MKDQNQNYIKQHTLFPIEFRENKEKRAEVICIISDLPANLRTVLFSYEYGNLSMQDIASIMRKPLWFVAYHLENARENVMRILAMRNTNGYNEKQVEMSFDWYADQMITDEQVERVLKPVVKIIKEKELGKSRLKLFSN